MRFREWPSTRPFIDYKLKNLSAVTRFHFTISSGWDWCTDHWASENRFIRSRISFVCRVPSNEVYPPTWAESYKWHGLERYPLKWLLEDQEEDDEHWFNSWSSASISSLETYHPQQQFNQWFNFRFSSANPFASCNRRFIDRSYNSSSHRTPINYVTFCEKKFLGVSISISSIRTLVVWYHLIAVCLPLQHCNSLSTYLSGWVSECLREEERMNVYDNVTYHSLLLLIRWKEK